MFALSSHTTNITTVHAEQENDVERGSLKNEKERAIKRRRSVGVLKKRSSLGGALSDKTNQQDAELARKRKEMRRKRVSFGVVDVRLFEKNANMNHTVDLGTISFNDSSKQNAEGEPQKRFSLFDNGAPSAEPAETNVDTINSSISSNSSNDNEEFFSPRKETEAPEKQCLSLKDLYDSPDQSDDKDEAEEDDEQGQEAAEDADSMPIDTDSDFAPTGRESSENYRFSVGTAPLASFVMGKSMDLTLSTIPGTPSLHDLSNMDVTGDSNILEHSAQDEAAMEMTAAHGQILQAAHDTEDAEMEMTTAHGQILASAPETKAQEEGTDMEMTAAHGQILQRSVHPQESQEEPEMEMTTAHGQILQRSADNDTADLGMEMTTAHGRILSAEHKGDITEGMEFTTAHGQILSGGVEKGLEKHFPANTNEVTMEFTTAFGKIETAQSPAKSEEQTFQSPEKQSNHDDEVLELPDTPAIRRLSSGSALGSMNDTTAEFAEKFKAVLAGHMQDKTCDLPSFDKMSSVTQNIAKMYEAILSEDKEVDMDADDDAEEEEEQVEHSETVQSAEMSMEVEQTSEIDSANKMNKRAGPEAASQNFTEEVRNEADERPIKRSKSSKQPEINYNDFLILCDVEDTQAAAPETEITDNVDATAKEMSADQYAADVSRQIVSGEVTILQETVDEVAELVKGAQEQVASMPAPSVFQEVQHAYMNADNSAYSNLQANVKALHAYMQAKAEEEWSAREVKLMQSIHKHLQSIDASLSVDIETVQGAFVETFNKLDEAQQRIHPVLSGLRRAVQEQSDVIRTFEENHSALATQKAQLVEQQEQMRARQEELTKKTQRQQAGNQALTSLRKQVQDAKEGFEFSYNALMHWKLSLCKDQRMELVFDATFDVIIDCSTGVNVSICSEASPLLKKLFYSPFFSTTLERLHAKYQSMTDHTVREVVADCELSLGRLRDVYEELVHIHDECYINVDITDDKIVLPITNIQTRSQVILEVVLSSGYPFGKLRGQAKVVAGRINAKLVQKWIDSAFGYGCLTRLCKDVSQALEMP